MLEEKANGLNGTEVDCDCFFSMYDAVAGECVLVCVASGVVRLTNAADDPGVGRQKDEKVEVTGKEFV